MNAPPRCIDCTLERCKAKPFFDLAGTRTAMGWTCLTCGHKWLVPETRPRSWWRRLMAWCLEPLT